MITNPNIRRIIASLLGISLLVPAFAFAETGIDAALNNTAAVVNTSAQVETPGANASVTVSATVMTRAKTKADQEIDRRIKALNDLAARINGMTKVNADIKTSITTNIQNQTSLLSSLKVKIDADTDGATLRTDVQSVTQSYRVFALMMPQARIIAAADREATILNMLAELGTKLQARLQAAATAGADVTALNSALTDMGTQLASGQTHTQASVTGIIGLTPDNGDKTVMASNDAALKTAHGEVQAAQQDFVAARKDAETIIKGLRTLNASASASTNTQVQQ